MILLYGHMNETSTSNFSKFVISEFEVRFDTENTIYLHNNDNRIRTVILNYATQMLPTT